jgi:hypothetical protein
MIPRKLILLYLVGLLLSLPLLAQTKPTAKVVPTYEDGPVSHPQKRLFVDKVKWHGLGIAIHSLRGALKWDTTKEIGLDYIVPGISYQWKYLKGEYIDGKGTISFTENSFYFYNDSDLYRVQSTSITIARLMFTSKPTWGYESGHWIWGIGYEMGTITLKVKSQKDDYKTVSTKEIKINHPIIDAGYRWNKGEFYYIELKYAYNFSRSDKNFEYQNSFIIGTGIIW